MTNSNKPVRARARTRRDQGSIVTSVNNVVDGEHQTSEGEVEKPVDVFTNHPSPAYVEVSGRITKNMGNFNSVQVGVVVTLPCDPTEEAVRECKDKCAELVDSYLDEEYTNAIGEEDDKK